MLEFLHEYTTQPIVLFAALIVIAWIWEDATVVCGALLASDQYMNVPLALAAVFIGICSGDLALFYLGRLAVRIRWLRRRILLSPKSRVLRRKFRNRIFLNIFVIRFIPGLRTLGFTLCGLWKISLRRFVLAMGMAGVLWVGLVFTLIYQLGSSEWFESSPWKWGLMAGALIILIASNFWSNRTIARDI